MAEILEAAMLVCFGLSWPMNAYKNYKARTAAGTSWQFLGLITFGYLLGMAAKFCAGSITWVLAVYSLHLACRGPHGAINYRTAQPARPAAPPRLRP